MSTAKEAVERSNAEMLRVGHALLTPDGTLLLNILSEMFYDADVIGKDANETYFKLGQREAVRFLRGLRDAAKEK